MAPSTTHCRLATVALLVLTTGPLVARAARIADGLLSESTSESAGTCGCRSKRDCSCSAYLEQEGVNLTDMAEEICLKALASSGRIRSQDDVAHFSWGKASRPFFERFQGMMNFGDEIEHGKCLKPGTCFPELIQACSAHYGCDLAGLPDNAGGLCDKIFVTKEWDLELAALRFMRESDYKLWCGQEQIEAFCGKTKADIPEFPNACSRMYNYEGEEEDRCPHAFKFDDRALPEPTRAELAKAPPQFRRAVPNMLGAARHMERKRGLPTGTCYPWLVHVCKGHYEKKGCELGDNMPKACEFAFRGGTMDLASTAQTLFREGFWCSEGELNQACSKHFGCNLADAPEKAWGLCDNVFASKDWSYASAPAQLFHQSESKLWCSAEDIEGFCGKTEADIPQFPNECTRAYADMKAPEICPKAFQYEGHRGVKLRKATKSEVSAAPLQFEAFVPNMLGVAQYWESKRRLPKGTCYPWLVHLCSEHYSQWGCTLDEEITPKVCAMAGERGTKETAFLLFKKADRWCSEQDIEKACETK